MELWYSKAASSWEEALPLGNGRIGAMVWSGEALEKISLNEDSLWSGYPQDHNIPGADEAFFKAQSLAQEGKYRESQALVEEGMLGHFTQSYLPLGDLLLDFGAKDASEYRRSLCLDTAVSRVSFKIGDATFYRESFVSYPDQALVIRISADKPGAVSFSARFDSKLRYSVAALESLLVLDGIAPSEARPSYVDSDDPIIYEEDPAKKGMRFMALADFDAVGGKVWAEGESIRVGEADSIVIRLCARTSFNGPFSQPYTDGAPYEDNCKTDLQNALKIGYDELFKRHVVDYSEMFKRVELYLGLGREELPLPERLADWESAEHDPALFALLFQYGRYLLISSSRPGTSPANLQGIWNEHLRAPWSANYTININTQMNYWPAEAANLSDCHEPLLDFLETLRKTGAESAKIFYKAGGFVAHHNSDIWGLSSPVGEGKKGAACYGFFPLAAGWLSAHAFDHYLYAQDKDYLKSKAWPILKEAAMFFLDSLAEDQGTLSFVPCTSPENSFRLDGDSLAVSKTSTMATAIIRETLSNALKAAEILNEDKDFRDRLNQAISRLPSYAIGSRGELLEWSEELEEVEPDHRHTSHLYPLYPGREITPGKTPDLAAACRRTLDLRGDESTGWALAWRINLFARLRDAERSYSFLRKLLRPVGGTGINYHNSGGCYPNLFAAHPPFQIDANFGACAGIAEMLLQSDENEITLLPALPKALNTGFVKGLRARGGIGVSIYFKDGYLESAELLLNSNLPAKTVSLRYLSESAQAELQPGIIYKFKSESTEF
ncbi:MAG: glycoside hydrolase family 95 protein [Clostridiales bacterium]|nr:glycoside hydrolase family 95 protein [Clostridiales bacterium]